MAKRVVPTGGKYYLDATETLEEAMQECIKEYSTRWTFYHDCQTNTAGDQLWAYQKHRQDFFFHRGHECFDHQRRLIASTLNDWQTNRRLVSQKFFYGDPAVFDTPEADDYAIMFLYSKNLPWRVFCNYGKETSEQYSIDKFLDENDIMAIFPWPDYPYFHRFEPMLP